MAGDGMNAEQPMEARLGGGDALGAGWVSGDVYGWLLMLEKVVDGSSNMVVVTDAQRRIRWVNATYTRVTGWTLEEAMGRRPRELLHGPQTDAEELSRLTQRLNQRDSVGSVELVNYKKSGEPYIVSLSIEPLFDSRGDLQAYLSIQTDVTERRRLEREALELGQRLKVAQRLARLGRIECDPQHGQPAWSSEVFRILGLEPDGQPQGFEHLLAHAHEDDQVAVRRALAAGEASGQEVEVEFQVTGVHGGRRWVRCRGRQTPGFCGSMMAWTVQDVTIYHTRLDERRRLNEVLNRQVAERTRKLEASNQALAEFSYALSHDLRAPLRHLSSFATLLQDELAESGPCPDSVRLYADKINQAAGKMQRLIEGLLSFARFGRDGLSLAPMDMGALVGELVAELRGGTAGREVRWQVPASMPTVLCDPILLREVWANLLDNALKYSGHREVSVVEIACGPHEDGWLFSVRDNGIGFDTAYADKLFGMFQRLHRDTRFGGEGIGLALVRRIVQSHGGRIWADARVNEGATFFVYLPSEPPLREPVPEVDAVSPPSVM